MEKRIIKKHAKGQKHIGKTDWSKLFTTQSNPNLDNENPELIGKRQFRKQDKQ